MTPDEISALAKDYIQFAVESNKLPDNITIREVDGLTQFVLREQDGLCEICYFPQRQAEQIILEIEEWVGEKYKTVEDESEADERNHIFYSGCQFRISCLIEEFISCAARFNPLLQKVSATFGGIPRFASRKEEDLLRKANESENRIPLRIALYKQANERQRLWHRVTSFAREYNYDPEFIPYLFIDDEFQKCMGQTRPPMKLLLKAFNGNVRQAERSPLGLALEEARVGLRLKPLGYESLIKLYYEGRDHLRAEEEFAARYLRKPVD